MASKGAKKLRGKSNWVAWSSAFELAAEKEGVLKLLKGAERVTDSRPRAEDFVIRQGKDRNNANDRHSNFRPVTPTDRTILCHRFASFGVAPPGRKKLMKVFDEWRSVLPASTEATGIHSALGLIEWQSALRDWDLSQQKLRTASELLRDSVSHTIKAEISPLFDDSPAEAYAYINSTYNSRADWILDKIDLLEASDCDCMSEYLHKHRLYQRALKTVGYTHYTRRQMADNILHGLPQSPSYREFRDDYIERRLEVKQDLTERDLDHLCKSLLNEEFEQEYERNLYRVEDEEETRKRRALIFPVCSYCEKIGHKAYACWTLNPALIPKPIRKLAREKSVRGDFFQDRDDGKGYVQLTLEYMILTGQWAVTVDNEK